MVARHLRHRVLIFSVCIVGYFISSFSAVLALDFSAAVSVLDGDTLEVLNGHHAERIRLSGIDCPEKGQASGKKAKQVAFDLAFGEQVTVQMHGYDNYKPTLGDVILPGG